MDIKIFIAVVVFCISTTNGLALPESVDAYDYHFNQLGVKFGLKLDDKSVPHKSGHVYLEFPLHSILTLIQGEPSLFKKMFVPFKDELYLLYTPNMLERMRDVLTVKAAITYKGENYKCGCFDTKMEYTFIHHDYTTETGTIHFETKKGKSLTMEVVSNNDVVLPKFVLRPFKIDASFKPNKEIKFVYKGTYGAIDMTLTKEGQSFKVHTVYKHEHEHVYDMEINVADKKMLIVHKVDGAEVTHLNFEIQGNVFNLKMIKMTGKIGATRWFAAGPIESSFVVKGNDYEFNVVHNTKEIMKININLNKQMLRTKINFDFMEEYKGVVYMNYDTTKKIFEITLPNEWFADNKKFGLTFSFNPINTNNPLLGGVFSALMMRDEVPFFKFDFDFEFISDAEKYVLYFKHVRVESLNTELVDGFFYMLPISKYDFCHDYLINGCFQKGEFTGRIFYDKVNRNNFFHKFRVLGKVTKMDQEVFDVIFDTVPTPYHFSVFYPRVFQRMFNKPIERLTLDVHHVVSGATQTSDTFRHIPDQTLAFITKHDEKEDMKVLFERKKDSFSAKIFKQEVPYVDFVLDEFSLVNERNYFVFRTYPKLTFHKDSVIRKELCEFSSYFCFLETKGEINLEISDKADGRVGIHVKIHKDSSLVYHLEANNMDLEGPYKFVFSCPYVVPLFKYMRGQTWFMWMMPTMASPFDITITFNPADKAMTLHTNIDTHETHMKIVPLGGNKFNIEFNNEVVAEFVAADKHVEFMRTLKDGTPLKSTVTWTGEELLENTATGEVMYRGTPQVATLAWNLKDLAHGTVKLDIVGKKAPVFGDFEFLRNIKWNIKNAHKFWISWDGKTSSNTMQAMATPIMTDAKITYNNNKGVQVKIEEKLNDKTFAIVFNTKPFKFALLPFFEV